MKRKWIFFIVAFILLSGCGQIPTPQSSTQAVTASTTSLATSPEIEKRIDDLLQQMTLEEKIGQMTQVERNSIQAKDITKYFIGSILSGGGSAPYPGTAQAWLDMNRAFQDAALQTRLNIPLIYGLDAIHGNAVLQGATVFPQPIGLGATRDAKLVYQVGQITAAEMMAAGVRWNFAPIIAVPQDIRWGRTYESYGENTQLVTQLGTAFLKGLQALPASESAANGQSIYVMATPKHFLGDGGTTFGSATLFFSESNPELRSWLDRGDMRLPEAKVREYFLPPYQDALNAGAMSVMVSFSSWNGVKMHAQSYWITDVLKGEMGFQGFVISDWAGMNEVASDYYTAVVTSINAGIDMNMVPDDYRSFIKTMKQAVNKGDIPISRIDDAVRRILRAKFALGIFDHPYVEQPPVQQVGSPEHRAIARKAVSESLVLLKNDKNALPIDRDTPSIYVAGVAADDIGIQCGGWTTEWQGKTGDVQPGTTILQGIQDTVSVNTRVVYSQFAEFTGMAEYGIAVVGEIPYAEFYGDKEDLSLSGYDVEIIEKLREHAKKLIVVIISGRPMIITDQYQVADAWVAAWLPGTEGQGVSDVLFGDHSFTGQLPYTWPRFNSQLPININNSSELKGCDAPLFPYGFGLGVAGGKPIKWLECQEFED